MNRFSFGLQKVLDFKVNIEEKKKEEFVTAQKHFLLCEEILDDLIEARKSAAYNTENLKTGYDYQNYCQYIDYLNKRVEAAKENLLIAEKELQIKKQELLDSTMDRKAIEKLKDKAKQEYDFEASKTEQKQNDDFALYSYMRIERR